MSASPAAYTNLQFIRPPKPTRASRKAEANTERDAETRVKRKVEQAHRVLCQLEARSSRLTLQIKELQRRKTVADTRASAIEDRILQEMGDAEKVTGLRVTFSKRPAPLALAVLDEKVIPPEYFRETLVSSVDKIAIKAALANGADIAGVALTQKVSLIRK